MNLLQCHTVLLRKGLTPSRMPSCKDVIDIINLSFPISHSASTIKKGTRNHPINVCQTN